MDEILKYWFEYAGSNSELTQQGTLSQAFSRWFGGQEDQLQHMLWRTYEGSVHHWPETIAGQLARIVFYDQLPRGCFRGTAQAFLYDQQALTWANRFLASAYPFPMQLRASIGLSHILIALICLSHAESLSIQARSLALSAEFSSQVLRLNWLPEVAKQQLAQVYAEAQQHHDVIQAFGRFPHRNQILNRASTPDEKKFLDQSLLPSWMCSQSPMKK